MKDYLESLIVEQVNRALTLKRMIRLPLQYVELNGLATRCISILDDRVRALNGLRSELRERDEDDLRDVFRDLRICTRDIQEVSYFGITPLYFQTPEIGFLNKLIFKISQEVGLPLIHPSVCCTATEYYNSNLFTNVIFVPLGESEFLLHLPDLYHEIGHYVLGNMETDLKLRPVKDSFDAAFSKVTDYYNALLRSKRREAGPEEIRTLIEWIHSSWKEWINEFFCDLFALYTAGPTYAWSNLHLAVKQSENITQFYIFQKQTHPSDESRMRILLHGLKALGFDQEAASIKARWDEIAQFWGKPPVEYQYAYPEELLKGLTGLALEGLKQSGFTITSRDLLSKVDKADIRGILNGAWTVFWEKAPEDFRKWEEESLSKLWGAAR